MKKCKFWYHETKKIIVENESILIAPFNEDGVFFAIHYCPWGRNFKYSLHFIRLDENGYAEPIKRYEIAIKANNYKTIENAQKRAQQSIGEYFIEL